MSTGYESLKGIVQNTLQHGLANPIARVKGGTASSLYDEMEELEKTVVDCIGRLKAAVKEGEAVVTSEGQHAERVIDSLRANIGVLEAKVRETEDTVHRKDSASQRMERSLTTKINDLQSEVKKKDEALESRDSEVNDLTAKIDALAKQVSQLEQGLQQNKTEAAAEAQRAQHLIEGSNAKITALETQLRETEEIVRGKDSTLKALEQNLTAKIQGLESQVSSRDKLLAERDKQVNDLKSEVKLLTNGIKEMSSFFKQAEALAGIQAQDILAEIQTPNLGAIDPGKLPKSVAEKPAPSASAAPMAASKTTEAVREAVAPNFFARMTGELSEFFGPMASVIVNDHVASLGESIEKFPKARIADLLDIVSQEISDKKARTGFRDRMAKL
jgi:chromosome segregation ATPase